MLCSHNGRLQSFNQEVLSVNKGCRLNTFENIVISFQLHQPSLLPSHSTRAVFKTAVVVVVILLNGLTAEQKPATNIYTGRRKDIQDTSIKSKISKNNRYHKTVSKCIKEDMKCPKKGKVVR